MVAGFQNAPISKALVVACGFFCVLSLGVKAVNLLSLSSQFLARWQLWRLITWQLYFSSLLDAIIGLSLLYACRIFERNWGSHQYGILLVFSWLMGIVIQVPMLFLAPKTVAASGPLPFIFACMVQFFCEIPSVTIVQVCGIPLSEKAYVYMLAFQLLITSTPLTTLCAAFSGILAGILYRIKPLKLRHLHFPYWFTRFMSAVYLSFSADPSAAPVPRAPPTNRNGYSQIPSTSPDSPSQGDVAVATASSSAPHRSSPVSRAASSSSAHTELAAPSAEAVEHLVSMGFDRGAVLRALSQTNNNVHHAAELLLAS